MFVCSLSFRCVFVFIILSHSIWPDCALNLSIFVCEQLTFTEKEFLCGRLRFLVLNALKKHEAQLPLEDASRAGRPTIISNRQSRALLKNLNQNRSQTSTELLLNTFGTEAYFSPRTLRRMLAKKGFRRVRASKVPLLTYLQQLRRYKFAIRCKHFNFNFLFCL